MRVHHTYDSVARICDAQIAALSAAQRRCSKLPSIQAWIGPARAWPIVPDRKLNVVYASRTVDKWGFGRALQALQASQGAGLETWSMYARLAPRSQCTYMYGSVTDHRDRSLQAQSSLHPNLRVHIT